MPKHVVSLSEWLAYTALSGFLMAALLCTLALLVPRLNPYASPYLKNFVWGLVGLLVIIGLFGMGLQSEYLLILVVSAALVYAIMMWIIVIMTPQPKTSNSQVLKWLARLTLGLLVVGLVSCGVCRVSNPSFNIECPDCTY